MNTNWDEEVIKALASFGSIDVEPIEYRIHYNVIGEITMCSMSNHPIDTMYLVVDQTTYENYFRYRVNVTKKTLEKVAADLGVSVKLKKSDLGYGVVKGHAGLILEPNEEYKDIEFYAAIN